MCGPRLVEPNLVQLIKKTHSPLRPSKISSLMYNIFSLKALKAIKKKKLGAKAIFMVSVVKD